MDCCGDDFGAGRNDSPSAEIWTRTGHVARLPLALILADGDLRREGLAIHLRNHCRYRAILSLAEVGNIDPKTEQLMGLAKPAHRRLGKADRIAGRPGHMEGYLADHMVSEGDHSVAGLAGCMVNGVDHIVAELGYVVVEGSHLVGYEVMEAFDTVDMAGKIDPTKQLTVHTLAPPGKAGSLALPLTGLTVGLHLVHSH